MTPVNIVNSAMKKGIKIIGICDHNSSENVVYALKYAKNKDILVIPGMEVTSKEEAHFVVLFNELDVLKKFQKEVYKSLSGKNKDEIFGYQLIVNEKDIIVGKNDRLLIGSIDMEIERLVKKVHKLDGLIIPSHIDRESFSIISQLGYLPEIDFDALEITERYSLDYLKEKFNFKRDYSLIMSSDAHYIEDIGKRHTEFFIEELSFDEIRFALYNRKDRKVRI